MVNACGEFGIGKMSKTEDRTHAKKFFRNKNRFKGNCYSRSYTRIH